MSPAARKTCGDSEQRGTGEAARLGACHPGNGAPCPSVLWNAMLHPLLKTTIRGAVWYQGESNYRAPSKYACLLPAMIREWRRAWHAVSHGETASDFPFGVVQISATLSAQPLAYALIRWAQSIGAGTVPNTFLVPAYDLGDATSPFGSVHTRYKQAMGVRLALQARKSAYGEMSLLTGPNLRSAVLHKASGEVSLVFGGVGPLGLTLPPRKLNASHQTSWSGRTPFELCSNPSGAGPRMSCTVGALLKGDDLRVANLSLAAATAWCLANASCSGFTQKAHTCGGEGVAGPVYFKRFHEGSNGDHEWRAHIKEVPCSAESGLSGWAPAASMRLADKGSSLILSGAADPPSLAVRFQWRAFPCERLGCGVYATAGDARSGELQVPPPPFYARLTEAHTKDTVLSPPPSPVEEAAASPAMAPSRAAVASLPANLSALGFLDVTKPPYSLDNTGTHDVTSGLQAAIRAAVVSGLAVYLRHGTYLVSRPLLLLESDPWPTSKHISDLNNTWACRFRPNVVLGERAKWSNTAVQGDGGAQPTRPIIRLADGAAGFDDPNKPTPVLDFTRKDNGHKPTIDGTNFNQVLRGVDIVIGRGTPGATGVMMPGAQGCSIQDVTVTVGSGFSGVTGGSGAGGGHTNVRVVGGRIGLDYRVSLNCPCTSAATLIGQTQAAILLKGLEAATFVGLVIKPAHSRVPALLANGSTGDRDWGQASFVDSVIEYPADAGLAEECTAFVTTHSLALFNVYLRRCAAFVPGVPGAARASWARSHELALSVPIASSSPQRACKPATMPIYMDGRKLPDSMLANVTAPSQAPSAMLTSAHVWDERAFPTWDLLAPEHGGGSEMLNARTYGAVGDGATDDTAAIQRAIDAAATARHFVFLPKGFYRLSRSLNLTEGCRGLVGAARSLSVLMPMSDGLRGMGRAPAPLLYVPPSSATVVLTLLTLVVWEHSAAVFAFEWRNANPRSVYRSAYSYRITECFFGFRDGATPLPWPDPPSAPSLPCKPSQTMHHPLLLLEGAAGQFYNLENEDFLYEAPGYRHLAVRRTQGPLRFYSLNMEHATSEANMELVGANDVDIYSFKTEGAWRDLALHGGRHNPAVGIWARNSSNIFVSSFGGNMRAMATGTPCTRAL